MRVLVIEDDKELAEAIGVGLRRSDMVVDVATEGRAGLVRALENDYDVIVLDRDLLQACRATRSALGWWSRRAACVCSLLTAAGRMDDLVDGSTSGATTISPSPLISRC